jgi:hypothetical protein
LHGIAPFVGLTLGPGIPGNLFGNVPMYAITWHAEKT